LAPLPVPRRLLRQRTSSSPVRRPFSSTKARRSSPFEVCNSVTVSFLFLLFDPSAQSSHLLGRFLVVSSIGRKLRFLSSGPRLSPVVVNLALPQDNPSTLSFSFFSSLAPFYIPCLCPNSATSHSAIFTHRSIAFSDRRLDRKKKKYHRLDLTILSLALTNHHLPSPFKTSKNRPSFAIRHILYADIAQSRSRSRFATCYFSELYPILVNYNGLVAWLHA
jgi:hypothetical protein